MCQFQNPGGWSREELSPNYNYDYPYTLVTGYDGLDNVTTPFTRTDGSELQRGDVWYNPNMDQRLTSNIGDVPESISVERSGYGYRDSTNLPAVYVMPTDDNGMPLRTFKDTATTSLPSGLLVDVQTEDGKVVSVIPSESSSPTGWTDGDTISIVGGSNTAMCRINIRNPAGWSDKFINKY